MNVPPFLASPLDRIKTSSTKTRKAKDPFITLTALVQDVFLEGPEGVKWELGLACFCPGKMGFRSLGLGFGSWEWEKKCQKWEWDKYFVAMTSRDITYFLGLRHKKIV